MQNERPFHEPVLSENMQNELKCSLDLHMPRNIYMHVDRYTYKLI